MAGEMGAWAALLPDGHWHQHLFDQGAIWCAYDGLPNVARIEVCIRQHTNIDTPLRSECEKMGTRGDARPSSSSH